MPELVGGVLDVADDQRGRGRHRRKPRAGGEGATPVAIGVSPPLSQSSTFTTVAAEATVAGKANASPVASRRTCRFEHTTGVFLSEGSNSRFGLCERSIPEQRAFRFDVDQRPPQTPPDQYSRDSGRLLLAASMGARGRASTRMAASRPRARLTRSRCRT